MTDPAWEAAVEAAPKFMCCLCFHGTSSMLAWQDLAGDKWDMCQPCAGSEGLELLKRLVLASEEPVSTGVFMDMLDRSRSFLGLPTRTDPQEKTQ